MNPIIQVSVIVNEEVVENGVNGISELGGLADLMAIGLLTNGHVVCAIVDWNFEILDQCRTLTVRGCGRSMVRRSRLFVHI